MKKLLTILIVAIFIIAGCQTEQETKGKNEFGDIYEKTEQADILPTFLNDYPEEIVRIYEEVPHYHDILVHMPCYCGCGEIGHRSSYDCFVKEMQEDGAIIWDEHGAKCNVCLEIAMYSIILDSEGASVQEIRQFIDERYKEGYLPPTNTPLPENM